VDEAQRKEDRKACENRSIPLLYLRQLRQSKALSQRALGELAGVSPGTVYRLENRLRGAYPVTVLALAAALEVPPAELVREPRPSRRGSKS
jgi:transcriptional regulator with XRE-family HTH domain